MIWTIFKLQRLSFLRPARVPMEPAPARFVHYITKLRRERVSGSRIAADKGGGAFFILNRPG